jgi:hypothetical protein
MCAAKDNDKNKKNVDISCCEGMAEMRKICCPDGIEEFECFAMMKEMMGKMRDKFNCNKDKPASK